MIEPFAREIIKELESQISTRKDVVTSGNMKVFDEYRNQCGVIEGLQLAVETVRETLEYVLKSTTTQ